MNAASLIESYPELEPLFSKANHIDIKTVRSRTKSLSLRQFVASMMSYQPGWVTFLYGVRFVFVRFLGMRQEGIPQARQMTPQQVPMEAGKKAAFFTVRMAKEDRYWFVEIVDTHLTAKLGVVMESSADSAPSFHVITIVHYHNWTGPIYFNVIRPFHHVVVGSMANAGINAPLQPLVA